MMMVIFFVTQNLIIYFFKAILQRFKPCSKLN